MMLTNIRDEPHRITQFELVLRDEEIETGLSHMDTARREYTQLLMKADKCSRRLTGYLEIALALEEMEVMELASRTGGEALGQEAH